MNFEMQWALVPKLVLSLGGVLFISLTVTWVILYYVRLLDQPNERSSHDLATPKCGGVGIVSSFLMGIIVAPVWYGKGLTGNGLPYSLVLPLFFVSLVSLGDDIRELSPYLRLSVQVVASLAFLGMVGIFSGGAFQGFLGFFLMLGAGAVSLVWLVGMANLYNFMDGIDGIAAGQGLVVAMFFALVQYIQGDAVVAYLALVLATGCLGFLAFNFPPAKVFMGDVGSVSIGFILACLGLMALVRHPSWESLLLMPLLTANFIFDGSYTLLKRIWRGENILEPHRSHLYQRFSQSGFSQRTVSMTNYGLAIIQGMLVLLNLEAPGKALGGVVVTLCCYYILVEKVEKRWRRQQRVTAAAAAEGRTNVIYYRRKSSPK